MGRAGRKGGASAFILLTPKWTRVKDPDEIKKRINSTFFTSANALLLDSNRPKALPKNSPLCQILNVGEEKLSDLESVAGLECDLELNKEVDLFSRILASDADQNRRQQKKELQTNLTNAAKQAKLPNEIFDYIHIAKYRRLFFLAWYDNLTYAQSNDSFAPAAAALLIACCNGLSYRSTEPSYIQRKPFIDMTTTKTTEADREWMACRTLALKQWRTEVCTRLWNGAGVKNTISESLVMLNCCLVALVKSEGLLNITELIEFLEPWHGVSKHTQEIFHYLEKNRPPPNPEAPVPNLPSKAKR